MFSYRVPKSVLDKDIPVVSKPFYGVLKDKSYIDFKRLPETAKEIKTVCYVRTVKSNKIVLLSDSEEVYIDVHTAISPNAFAFEEMGYAIIKRPFGQVFHTPTDKKVLQSLAKSFYIFPLGAFIHNSTPYICFNLIVSEDMLDYVKDSYTWGDIKNLKQYSSPLKNAIEGTFVITPEYLSRKE